ncbi:sensor histidine kinase [Bacteroidota bacterium]
MENNFNINNAKKDAQQQIEALQKEVQYLTKTIHDLNYKLENTETFKTHFISNITNELINPFTSIIGLSKVILSVKKEEWKKVISMVALIHSEAFILEYQLKNLFTAAKIEAGIETLHPVKLDVKNFIDNIDEIFKLESRKNNITIKYHYDKKSKKEYFITDHEKLKIILANIIQNAMKFSSENSEIKFYCYHNDNSLTFKIQDEGIGIPKEKFEAIFDRFERLNNNINSINHGQGIGLSVSVSLLDMLGGEISLSSKENVGSEFTFKIPELKDIVEDISITDGELFFNDGETF